MIRRLRAAADDKVHLWLMLALTFGTGIIDAVGYLGLDRVFTGNMTGNVVILGMAVVGGDDLPVLGPVLALVGFMAGAAVGGRVLKGAAPGWTPRTSGLFGAVSAVLVVLAVALLVVGDDLDHTLAQSTTLLLGAAMGLQAATARFIAVRDVTTVVITSTITGLAADSVLGNGKGGGGRRLAAIVLMLVGAAAGALLLELGLGWGVLVSGVIAAGVTAAGAWHARGARAGDPVPVP